MSIVEKANLIINDRSEEKSRQYGPMTEGMIIATDIADFLDNAVKHSKTCDNLGSYRYLYGLKLSRQRYNHKEDNLLDAIAYRIAEINAILELNNKLPLTKDQFNILYAQVENKNFLDIDAEMHLVKSLTKHELTGDDMFKIHLAIEISNEKKFIDEDNLEARIFSILKQINLLDLMNEYNL